MKKLLLVPLLALVASLCFAQNQTLPQKLQHLYAPLDKAQVQTGYLFDLSWSFANPSDYRGVLTDSNYVSSDVFGMLYGAMRGSRTAASGLPSAEVYLSKIKALFSDDTIPLAAMALRFDRIRPDAVDQNLLSLSNGQMFDVPGRAESPYFQDTVFVAMPLKGKITSRSVSFTLPTDLWFSNLSGPVPVISLDPGDGQGWRTLSAGQSIAAEYPSDGEKEVVVRLEYVGFTRYSHSKLEVLEAESGDRSGGMSWPQNLYESMHVAASESYMGAAGGATLHIFYNTHNCNSVKRMVRPLIVVEGYEEYGVASASYGKMFDLLNLKILNSATENLTDYLYPYEYDLIYVDFDDGSDWIQRNAFVVKEVIKKVNEMKAAAGSVEENVIIGVSMGGIVSKYALLEMQANGPDHDTRLFFTYDSPLRGANIPIATQCLIKFMVDNLPTYAGDGISIPSIDAIWDALQAPVPRQLLKYHVNGLSGGPGLNNVEHEGFMTELDALGGLNMRHVALSNGAGTGTFVENNIVAGELFFDLDGQKIICFTLPPPLPPIVLCGDVRFELRLRATGDNVLTQLFYGYIERDIPGPSFISTSWSVSATTKPYDTSPGGTSNLGTAPLGSSPKGLMTALTAAGVTTWGPGLTATHHCFIPTFSSVNASEPSNFGSPISCGAADRCTTASSPEPCPYGPFSEINQTHVFLDERIALVLTEELVTNSPPPLVHPLALSGALNTYFNVGLSIYSPIPTVTISTTNGKLSVNNTGKVAFATGNEPNSPHALLIADTKCNAVITVENGAKLVVGADGGVKHGILRVSEGSTVHIKSGGILYVTSEQSHLIIKHGATLILDAGAVVRLESPGSSISILGDLVVNGDIIFGGLGYFNFAEGNRLVFGNGYNTFNLTGMGKDKRFVQLSADVLIDNAHRLNWQKGLLEASNGKLLVTDGAGLDFKFMTLTGGDNGGQAVIEATSPGAVNLQGCKVEKLIMPIFGMGGFGCSIIACEFSQYFVGVLWEAGFLVSVTGSIFDGGSNPGTSALQMKDVPIMLLNDNQFFSHHDLSIAGIVTDGDLSQGIPAVNLDNMVACLVKGCTFTNNSIGIKSDNPSTATTANVLAYGGTGFYHNEAGIYLVGDATQGTVLADCVTFDQNRNGIRGHDIALMIDSWNSNIFAFDSDSPNSFIRMAGAGPGATESHVRICYGLKGPGGSNLMRNNFWGLATGGVPITDPTPLNSLFLLNTNCAASVAAPILPPIATRNISCPMEERPESFATPFPGSECMLVVGSGGTTGNPIQVHEQFHLGTFLMKSDSVEAGIEAMRPVATLWQPEMSGFSDNCQQYIRVAKAFVDASDSNLPDLQRPGSERAKVSATGRLLIAPNPASNSALLQLPSAEYQVRVWDTQGKVCHQATASDTYRLETSAWQAGIYYVEAVGADGSRRSGKLVVQR